jgi:hypothetical protein
MSSHEVFITLESKASNPVDSFIVEIPIDPSVFDPVFLSQLPESIVNTAKSLMDPDCLTCPKLANPTKELLLAEMLYIYLRKTYQEYYQDSMPVPYHLAEAYNACCRILQCEVVETQKPLFVAPKPT